MSSFDSSLGPIPGAGSGGGSDDQTAAEVPFTPTGAITATDTQAAVEQVASITGAAGSVARENISGAATLDVAGHDAAILTLTGDVTSLAWSGWVNDTNLSQEVLVAIVQDATGGHVFDGVSVSGDWLVLPPATENMVTTPNDEVLVFKAFTFDAGAKVYLCHIGVELSLECLLLDAIEVDVGDVPAAGIFTVSHPFSMVTSVELVRQGTIGRRVLADWWQQDADPAGAVNIDFTSALTAGEMKARIAGKQTEPCDLVSTFGTWVSTPLSIDNAASFTTTIDHTGTLGQVQWIPEPGDTPIDVPSGVALTHNFSSTGDHTPVLRWRPGVGVLAFDDTVSSWSFGVTALPSSMQSLTVRGGANTLNGSVGDLPAGLTYFDVQGQNTISGGVDQMPTGMTFFRVFGSNTTSGDVAGLPPTLERYQNRGNNATSGDVGLMPATLEFFQNLGNNTTSGAVSSLPAGLTYYQNEGSNITSGDIGLLPSTLDGFFNFGSNTTFGNVDDLPAGLTDYDNRGSNTTAGDVGALPAGLELYRNWGSNTTSGSVSTLPSTLTTFDNQGLNTVSGDVSSLPTGLTTFQVTGSNTTSGAVASLPAGLVTYENTGLNTTTGDAGLLPASLRTFDSRGFSAITYVTANSFTSLDRVFRSLPEAPGVGLSTGEVDQILIDIAAAGLSPSGDELIVVDGLNAPRSAVSDAAVATLTGAGWTVITN